MEELLQIFRMNFNVWRKAQMKKDFLRILCLSMLLIGESGGITWAMPNFLLDEVVVTANRYPKKWIDVNADVDVITNKEIENSHIDSIEKVLRKVSGTSFFNYAIPGYRLNKILLNGSGVVVTMVDGIPVNMVGRSEGSHEPGYTGFLTMMQSMRDIERVEVLKGAAGVQYGSGAVGGVINIITKQNKQPGGMVETSAGSFGRRRFRFDYNFSKDNFQALIYGSRYRQRDIHAANEFVWRGSDTSDNYGIKMHYAIGGRNDITIRYDKNKRDFETYDFVYNQHLYDGIFNARTWTLIWDFRISDTLTNRMSYLDQDYLHRTAMEDKYGVHPTWFYDSHIARNFSDQLIKKFSKHTILLGTDVQYGKLRNISHLSSVPHKTVKSSGIYLQDSWDITPKWNFTAGVRYDRMEARKSGFDPNWTKSFSIGHKFSDYNKVYASYNEYLVLPSLSQMYSTPWGNPNLLPERGRNYQIGYNHIFNNGMILKLSGFTRKSRNKVHYVGKPDSGTYRNGDGKTSGFEIGLAKSFGLHWDVGINYSYLDFPLKDNSLSANAAFYAPRNTITSYFNFHTDRWQVSLDARAFLGRCGDNNFHIPEDEVMPSSHYWVVNLGTTYHLTDNISFFAQIDNVFNRLYAERTNAIWPGGGIFGNKKPNRERIYYMPGRSVLVGVNCKI